MTRAGIVVGIAALAAAGCSPNYGDGGFYCTDGVCPAGFVCVVEGPNRVCRKDGTPAADAKTRDKAVGDKAVRDKAAGDKAAVTEAGPVPVDCTGKADGTNCVPAGSGQTGLICLAGKCVSSSCSDKFTDTANGEDCDDGNTDPTDGCNNCKFGCKASADCDDKASCNGTETCDTGTHKCQTGTAATDGTPCTQTSGSAGVCNGGLCAPAGCGNSVKDGTEECDDGNKTDGDGCNNDCTFSCHADGDCNDGDACNGTETCKKETTKQTCTAGTAPNCDDGKTCTSDTCDPTTGCANTPIDGDKDGHAAAPCGDDCNDFDPTVYTGAPECADGKDNNCNGQKDESPVPGKCWADSDGDTYATTTATMINSCACPSGHTNRDPSVSGQADCREGNASVFPGQTKYFTSWYCKTNLGLCLIANTSYDYNCDGAQTKQYSSLAAAACTYTSALGGRCSGSGWVGALVPACGDTGTYKTCAVNKVTGVGCVSSQSSRTQACR